MALSLSGMPYERPHEAASWLLDDLADGAAELGRPLTDEERELLAGAASDAMTNLTRDEALNFNNEMVTLIRGVINLRLDPAWKRRRKASLRASGGPGWRDLWFNYRSKRACSGIRAPLGWLGRYEILYDSNADIMLSPVMQNVILGNSAAGETGPWRN